MRLIDADALFKEFERTAWYNNADRDEIAEEILLQMPTIDAVPVVRCKDCNHWNNACCGLGTGDCHVLERLTFETFFCSYGERRSE